MGQSLWLDNITRGLLSSGTLRNYIRTFRSRASHRTLRSSIHAIKNSHDYDDAIRQKLKEGKPGEALFFELAIEDLNFRRGHTYSGTARAGFARGERFLGWTSTTLPVQLLLNRRWQVADVV